VNRGLAWRSGAVFSSLALALFFLFPGMVGELPSWWPGVFPSESIRMGLDLQGGIHLVLEVDSDKAVANQVDFLSQQLKRELRDEEIATRDWTVDGDTGFSFDLVSRSKRDRVDSVIADRYGNVEAAAANDGRRLSYRFIQPEVDNIKQLAVDQALETIRNRVDEFGVNEPTIQRTGKDGILIQLPGVQDPERAKTLIGRTAQLEFLLVADRPGKAGEKILTGFEVDPLTGGRYDVQYNLDPEVIMTGEVISDARHRPGQLGDSPYVLITLNGHGASIFERVTRESVGRQLAIVLDGKVQSAPVIRERIGGGVASITGNFTLDEARDLAIVLRAGALPAPVTIAEERTVGPSLGRDSIINGTRSFMLGGVMVIIFMMIYYRFSGFLADLSLILNVVLLLGVLAGFEATLTLPGIAGIVLTLGMAVDANVLINERVREELRQGQPPRAALDAGYSRALPAILDSNLTTFLAGLILFQFGSGPIKGFALTLCVGIGSTIFSAVFASRVFHDLTMVRSSNRSLSI
jgi:preprotein translocase subunit SecD